MKYIKVKQHRRSKPGGGSTSVRRHTRKIKSKVNILSKKSGIVGMTLPGKMGEEMEIYPCGLKKLKGWSIRSSIEREEGTSFGDANWTRKTSRKYLRKGYAIHIRKSGKDTYSISISKGESFETASDAILAKHFSWGSKERVIEHPKRGNKHKSLRVMKP